MSQLELDSLVRDLQDIKRRIKQLEAARLGQTIPAGTLGEITDLDLRELSNLSDLTDVSEARDNLGLGTMALEEAGAYYTAAELIILLAAKLNKTGDTMTGSIGYPIRTVTAATVTLTSTDHTVLCDTSSNNIQVNLPGAGICQGRVYVIKIINNTNSVTVVPNGVQKIDDADNYVLNVPYETVIIQSNGANWWVLGVPAVFVS